MRDHTAVVSPLGFELQFQGWLLPNLSLGVSGEWSSYVDDRERATYDVSDTTALTATAYNWTQTTAAHFIVHYFFLEDGPVLPYIGPHVGISWSTFQTDMVDLALADTETSVNFGLEGGIQVPFGYKAPVGLVNVRYALAPAAEFLDVVSDVQSLSMMIGLGF